jgi:hypothetical protein
MALRFLGAFVPLARALCTMSVVLKRADLVVMPAPLAGRIVAFLLFFGFAVAFVCFRVLVIRCNLTGYQPVSVLFCGFMLCHVVS